MNIIIKNKFFTVTNELHFFVSVDWDGTVTSSHSKPEKLEIGGFWLCFGGEVIGKFPDYVPDWQSRLYSYSQDHAKVTRLITD